MKNKFLFGPPLWGGFILALAQTFAILLAFPEKTFVVVNQVTSPQISAGFPIAYFFGAAVIIGIVLFFIPLSSLKYIFKFLFALLFAWGLFIITGLMMPTPAAIAISVIAGFVWLSQPRVWYHDLLLLAALVSLGTVFGYIISAWAVAIFMVVISVYDVLAVRLGYMVWMAKKMSSVDTLPAFVIPAGTKLWNLNLRGAGKDLINSEAGEREFSILGGGDIGFPLIMAISVFFTYGLAGAIVIAVFSILGLFGAYAVQFFIFKGKPTPALPPITISCLIGLLVVYLMHI